MMQRHLAYRIVLLAVADVFFATAQPMAATPMRLIDALKGESAGQRLGDACEGLGDINGDGYSDFLTTGRRDRELRLYLGGPHPFDNPPAITWHNHCYDVFSFSPVNLGDIDCDGVNDFASMFGNWDSLKVFTGLENLDPNDYFVISPAPSGRWDFTMRISGGGDNNNDGRNEFWIHDYYKAKDTVLGYIGCDLLDTVADFVISLSRNPDNQYITDGICVLNTCDLNGDGISDIVYGQGAKSPYPGRVCIIWGGSDLSTSADLVFYAPMPHAGNPQFGGDIDCLGDISGDGIDDLWVSQGGRNYIFYGGHIFDTFPDVGLDWSYMYIDMENVGDVNHDGWNDVILVDESYLINRVSYIYCDPTMDTLVDVVYSDFDFYYTLLQGPVCCVGIDHSWAGDINGDGMDDILISGRTSDVDANDLGWLFIQSGWDGIPVDISTEENDISPAVLDLSQNRPNPFNGGTVIEFFLPKSGYVQLRIYNLLGELVCEPVHEFLPAGEHRFTWDGKDTAGRPTPTGVYIYMVKSGELSEAKKMILLK